MIKEQQKTVSSTRGVPFTKGDSRINTAGRKKQTEVEKIGKRAIKEYIEEYKQKLAEALPQIEPVLVAKAMKGNMFAIKEVNDRVLGKPKSEEEAPPNANYFLQVIQNIINEPNKTIIGEDFGTGKNDESVGLQVEKQSVEIKQPVSDNKQTGSENSVQTEQATDLLTGKPTL